MSEGAMRPRPETTARLIGHGAAERALLAALGGGRMPHAWLLTGPEGVGKATLAFRAARFMLAHGDDVPPDADTLQVPEEHPVFGRVAAGSHPDLFVLRRSVAPGTKRLRQEIVVEDARRLGHFLSLTASADDGWRVVIVDVADEMNRSTANAILKILEEPPAKVVFFLASHAPGGLLPTIRSRCRRLALRPLCDDDAARALAWLAPERPAEEREKAARLADGSPGLALKLLESKAAEWFSRCVAARGDAAALHAIARAAAGAGQRADFDLFMRLLDTHLTRQAADAARQGDVARARRIAEAREAAMSLLARTRALNLDAGQTLAAIFAGLPERI